MKKNREKKIRRYLGIIILPLLVLFVASCDDDAFFETDRNAQSAWRGVSDMELSVNDAYKGLFLSFDWSDPQGYMAYLNFVISDISQPVPSTPEHSALFWIKRDFDYVAGIGEDRQVWSAIYRAIGSANFSLDFLEEKNAPTEDAFSEMNAEDRETIARQMGELYFMRGYSYYLLSRFWVPPYNPNGDNSATSVPLKDTFEEDPTSIRQPYLGSTEEVYQLMLSDFSKAKSLIPTTYSVDGKASTYAAAAMLYKIHWLMGNMNDALTEINYVINSGEFQLAAQPIDNFNRNYGDPMSPEVIWDRAMTAEGNRSPKNYGRMTKIGHYVANNGGRGADWKHSWATTMYLADTAAEKIGWLDATDPDNKVPTAEALSDLRYDQLYYFLKAHVSQEESGIADTDAYKAAYPDWEYENAKPQMPANAIWVDKYHRAPVGWHSQVPLIRLAELHLSRASILLANGDESGAKADINAIRNRAGLANFVGTLTEDDIENERIKEMATEHGDRMFYLIGMQKTVGEKLDESWNTVPAMSPPYSEFVGPIPVEETDFWNF